MSPTKIDPVFLRIQELQQYFNVNDANMSRILGISHEAYRQQRLKKKAPQLYSLMRLDQKYGISVEWILFKRGPMLLKTREEEMQRLINPPGQDLFHEDVVNMEKEMRKFPKLRHKIMQIYSNHLLESDPVTE